MNIGIFTDTYFPQVSGVATSIKTLRDELIAQGHHVYIFTTTDPKAKHDDVENGYTALQAFPLFRFLIVALRCAAYFGLSSLLKSSN